MKYIFIDVDGVLNALGSNPGPDYFPAFGQSSKTGFRYSLCLNKQHAKWLLGLSASTGANLAWATTWQDDANTEIGPKIGLPMLPVVYFEPYTRKESVGKTKARGVAKFAGENSFVWFDDGLDVAAWLNYYGAENGRSVDVDPMIGLQLSDIERAERYLTTVLE